MIPILLCRMILLAVFYVSGISKVFDRVGFRKVLIDFGFPRALAPIFSMVVPFVEIVVATALLFHQTAFSGGIGAISLVSIFVIGISYNLAKGRKPDCHCFGQLLSKPIGKETLIRNGILFLMAAFVVWQGRDNPGPGLLDWIGSLSAVEIIALTITIIFGVVAAIEGWLLLHILQQQGRFLVRIETLEKAFITGSPIEVSESNEPAIGLALASDAPTFHLTDLDKQTVSLSDLQIGGKPLMLVFSDPGCGPCNALMPNVANWQKEYASVLNISVISRGAVENNLAKQKELGLINVLLQKDHEVAEMYQCSGTPGAVVVQSDGTIGSYLAIGADAIERLVLRTVSPVPASLRLHSEDCNCRNGQNGSDESHSETLMIGQLAPTFELPDLNGVTVSLDKFYGHETVIIFWNPGCGFCNQMLNDLKVWENQRPSYAPELFLVSTGDISDNRAQGIQSIIVLDQGFSVANQFGAGGTPSAVLVDAWGKIASEVVVGAQAVLELARLGVGAHS